MENYIQHFEDVNKSLPKHFNLVPVIINGRLEIARYNSIANGWFKENNLEKRIKVTHWLNAFI